MRTARRQSASRISPAAFDLNGRVRDAEAIVKLVRHAVQPIVIDASVGLDQVDGQGDFRGA